MQYIISDTEVFAIVTLANPDMTMQEAQAQTAAQIMAMRAIREARLTIRKQTFGDMITSMEHAVSKHKASQS